MDTNSLPPAANGYEAVADTIIAGMNVSPDDREVYLQLREDLVNQLDDCVNAAILRAIPDEKQEEFGRILDLNSDEEVAKFYEQVIGPEKFASIVTGELIAFKNRFPVQL